MKRIKTFLLSLFVMMPLTFALATPVLALSGPGAQACQGAGGTVDAQGVTTCDPSGLTAAFKTVANTLIFLVGAISVIMIIVGGLRYVLSGGDSAGVKGAKDTILYAVVGVAVSILAYAIVNFVITRIG